MYKCLARVLRIISKVSNSSRLLPLKCDTDHVHARLDPPSRSSSMSDFPRPRARAFRSTTTQGPGVMASFIQPQTIHIHEHEICSPEDWPEQVECQWLVDVLNLRADDSAFPTFLPTDAPASGSGKSTISSELESAASLVSTSLAALERLGQPHASHGLTWPYICKLFATIWPDEEPNYGATFVAPIDPCSFDDATARFVPAYMEADAILTTRLAVPAHEAFPPAGSSWVNVTPPLDGRSRQDDIGYLDSASNEGHSKDGEVDERSTSGASARCDSSEQTQECNGGPSESAQGCEDRYRTSYAMPQDLSEDRAEESWGDSPGDGVCCCEAHHSPDTCPNRQYEGMVAGGMEQGLSEAIDWSVRQDDDVDMDGSAEEHGEQLLYDDGAVYDASSAPSIQHVQLLAHAEESFIDMAMLCASSPTKLYCTMASAVLQRRALGLTDAMVGVVCDPGSPCLRLALGWTTDCPDIGCLEVHVACGAAAAEPCRGLGIFDLRKPEEALRMGYCLAMLRDNTREAARLTEEHLPSTLTGPQLCWRLDLAGRGHSDPDRPSLQDRINAWCTAVACSPRYGSLSLSSVDPMCL
ncbi:hypothetical protein OE88DRAFT_818527 [Heliocybe sulcata]|uniref:Uncharacterized protein n=1 Tax=Heliocybe sulcata TaxID=5364 RepID=A0A5C3N023_9AGAM|nr:hypothetical protein OE88DRAFT_818527 [Heliocybe sulcata]